MQNAQCTYMQRVIFKLKRSSYRSRGMQQRVCLRRANEMLDDRDLSQRDLDQRLAKGRSIRGIKEICSKPQSIRKTSPAGVRIRSVESEVVSPYVTETYNVAFCHHSHCTYKRVRFVFIYSSSLFRGVVTDLALI